MPWPGPKAESSLDRELDLELRGRERHAQHRRLGLGILALVVIAALLGLFGQESTTTVAAGRRAVLTVEAPQQLRGGLIFQARFEIEAKRRLAHPRLALSPGWLEAMTSRSAASLPSSSSSRSPASSAAASSPRSSPST